MKIQFVDLARQNKLYKKELTKAIDKVVSDASFILGDDLSIFEKRFASFCKKKYCIGLNSGTDALLFALLAIGIQKGDEVITVPNSYFSTAMVISQLDATPIFVDVEEDSFNMDPALLEKKITKKTKAIIPVHIYGQSADMDGIVSIAKQHKLAIIEDCCQAHGAKYKGKIVPFTNTGAFSFYPGKNLGSFGDGGALVTNSSKVKNLMLYLRNDGSKIKYKHEMFGYKSRLDTLQAAILNVKLKHLNEFVRKRRKAAALYNKYLSEIIQIKLPKEKEYAHHAYHVYAIRSKKRDALQKYLAKKGIATVIHYPIPIHLQKAYKSFGFKKGDFPITEKLANEILSLPIFPEIKEEEIKYVAKMIKNFFA